MLSCADQQTRLPSPTRRMNVFWCDAASNPFDEGLTQSPTADATADPNEGPATTNLHGEDYVFFKEQVVEVLCQSHDTLTSELSFLHHDGMVLKASDDSLMSEASPYDMSHLDLQPQVWEVDDEVQEKPTLNISSMDFHTEPEAQRFISMYSIGNLLGSGGFGLVYEGVRKSDGQQVAFKFILEKDLHLHINLPGETCKLHIEVALMKMVSKPPLCNNILQLLDWFEVSNFLLLVLERPVPSMDVFSLYESKGWVLDELLAKIIMLQVVEAANHCFKVGVFHSDIKMENLLFNPDTLYVKLIDFGCGDLWQDTPYKKFRGTRGFQPPEWILQQQYHAYPATVWTLGILLYNLVCGELPFSDEEEIIEGTLTFRPGPSEDCLHLIKWCLQQNPAKRPSFRQISQHPWFTKGLHLTDMGLQEEMGGVKSKADDTLMPETPHQRKVGVLQSSDMGTQRSNYAFPEHVDPQQILKTLKTHFVLW